MFIPVYDGKPVQHISLQWVTLTTIAEQQLPRGFRDVNAQLAMFLQHWDYTQAGSAQ